MNVWRRIAIACAVGYGTVFALWRGLVASPLYAVWWPLQVSELLGLWALAPLPVLLVAGLVWRSRWGWLAFLLPTLWFGYTYGDQFLPELTQDVGARRVWARGDAASLRVMTLNSWELADEKGELAAAMRAWQPDILALQEVRPNLMRDVGELADGWPYQVHAYIRVFEQVALISKTPILDYVADGNFSGCHCLQALVEWHSTTIRVVVVHIRAPSLGVYNAYGLPFRVKGYDGSQRAKAYAALAAIVAASREPVIVLGDFNTTEREAGYAMMYGAGLTDAHAAVGWGPGFTYPAPFSRIPWLPFPVIRIDHIFYDDRWRATQTWTTPLIGSDHQTLMADLQWMGDP